MEKFDKQYLKMAFIWAENSYAVKRKVGALLVKNNMIISDGYNGTPSGFENVCEYAVDIKTGKETYPTPDQMRLMMKRGTHRLVTKPFVLHAEANAISKVAKSTNSCEGATLYITDSPCMECSKLIIQAGIKRVVYCRLYTKTEGLDLLREGGVKVERIYEADLGISTEKPIQ